MNPNINPEGLPNPFTHFCMTIGAIPTSYKNALDYYETLLWLIKYLENTVIPAVDNNAETLTELQSLFVELKNYVADYFTDLDVQEEINNKLDEMATDGTLTNLIKDYVDPIYEDYETTINNRIAIIENQVSSVASGSPLVASSTSEMTDTTRTYVNTTDGKWYYYDGDSWEIGGTYQSTAVANNSVQPYQLTDIVKNSSFKFVTESDINYVCLNLYAGGPSGSADSITTGDYILFKAGDVIQLVDDTDYKIRVSFYDYNKTYIKQVGYNASSITIDIDCFARISVSKNDGTRPMVADISDIISFSGLIVNDLSIIDYKELSFLKSTSLPYTDWEVGAILDTTGVPYNHNKRVRTIDFHAVEAGDFININVDTGLKAQIIMYEKTTHNFIGKLDNEDKWCYDRKIIIDRDCDIKIVLWTGKPTGTDAWSVLVTSDLPNFDNIVTIYKNINASTDINIVTEQTVDAKIDEEFENIVLPNSNILSNSAHRGYYGGNALPENTIIAYQYAANKKFDYIETDVRLTSDDVPIICHDDTINRTARNVDGTTIADPVPVASNTFDTLDQYDYGIYKGPEFAGTHLLTFEEVCRFAKYNNIKINIDCKIGTSAGLDILYAYVQQYGLQYQVRWTLSDSTLINYLLTKNPRLEVALGAWNPTTTHVNTAVNLRQTYPFAKILLDFYVGNMDSTIANAVRSNDMELSCYCENNTQIINAVNYGASYLTVNLQTPYALLKNTYNS